MPAARGEVRGPVIQTRKKSRLDYFSVVFFYFLIESVGTLAAWIIGRYDYASKRRILLRRAMIFTLAGLLIFTVILILSNSYGLINGSMHHLYCGLSSVLLLVASTWLPFLLLSSRRKAPVNHPN